MRRENAVNEEEGEERRETAKFGEETTQSSFTPKEYSLDLREQMQQGEIDTGRCDSSLVRDEESRMDT